MKASRLIGLACLSIALHPPLVAAVVSDAAPLYTRVGESISVPAEVDAHIMYVNIMVNGHGPFRVMVDTGCSITLVSPQLAEAAGATVTEDEAAFVVAQNGLGNPTDVEQVLLESVDLGGARFEGVPAAVSATFDQMSAIHGRRIDGTLGFPLFHDLYFGLDFPNHRLLLGSHWPDNLPQIRATLPVVEHADVPFVEIQVQGSPVEVMIDTGANQALQLPLDLAASFQWKVAPRAGPLVAVVGEIGREGIGRLAGNVLLGDVQEVEPTAVVSSGQPSIGCRTLESFCVIFHESENKVWLCGPTAAPIGPTAERSVGLSLYPDRGGWRVAGVIPGSPADDAHVAAGSMVTQIEDQPATSWTRDQMEEWIYSHTELALTVGNGTDERALTLPVWNLVP